MNLLVAIGAIAGSLWFVRFSLRLFWRRSAALPWKIASLCLLLAGVALGIKLAFFFEYQISDRMRAVSFPLPIVFFVWEEDRWTDFVTPDYYVYPALAANVCATAALCLAPLVGLFALLHRQRNSAERTAGPPGHSETS